MRPVSHLRAWIGVGFGLSVAIGLTVMERIEVALSAMHRAGDVSGQVGGIAAPTSLWSPEAAREMIRAWHDWDADRLAVGPRQTVVSPVQAVLGHALINSALVTIPLMVLLILLAFRTRQLVQDYLGHLLESDTRGPEHVRAQALERVAILGSVSAAVYGAADLSENALTAILVRFGDPWWAVSALGFLSLVKVVGFAAAVAPVVLVVGVIGRPATTGWLRRLGRQLVALRAQVVSAGLVAAVFLALRGELGLQIDDVVMRWIEQPNHLAAAVLAALAMSLLIALSGEECCAAYEEPPRWKGELRVRTVVAAGLVGLVLLVAGLWVALGSGHAFGYAAVFPGAALTLFGALSWPGLIRRVPPPAPAARPPAFARWPIWGLAVVPVLALALGVVRTAVTLAVTWELRALVLFAVALVLLALAVVLVVWRPRLRPATRRGRIGLWLGVAAAALLLAGYAMVWPLSAGAQLGAIALLYLFAATVLLVLTGLHVLGDRFVPAGVLALVGLRRVPLIALFVAWCLVTSLIDRTGHYYDVRLGDELSAQYRPVTLDEAVDAWLDKQKNAPVVGGKRQVPMIFVATAGGGIRSAYWTGLVLDCLFAPSPHEPNCIAPGLDKSSVFVASGISGGSLGLAVDRALEGTDRTFKDVLDRDLLSPDVAALAFRDLPNSLLRLEPRGQDRAAVMERTWESAAGSLGQGFFASARDADGVPRFPLLMLNSATVDDGCRVSGSPLTASTSVQLGPQPPSGTETCLSLTPFDPGRDQAYAPGNSEALAGSKDLYDLSCTAMTTPVGPMAPGMPVGATPARHDLRMSTVALLSARFPFVSPTGALTSCGVPQHRTFALDGGLLESSAVSPLTELWARLSGRVSQINQDKDSGFCIEPRLLMLDNGYSPAASTGDVTRPQELAAPTTGLSLFSSTKDARLEQAAALAFDHAFGTIGCRGSDGAALPVNRVASPVAHIVPTVRPGPHAPLGWSLSQFARHDLDDQLQSSANLCQVALVRSWFHLTPVNGTIRCVTGFVVRAESAPPGSPPVTFLPPPVLPTYRGQAGVTVTVPPADAAIADRASVTTDSSGRFYLLLKTGQQATVEATVQWGGQSMAAQVPAGTGPIETGVNFLVTLPSP
jgi:hypothetical protein